MTSREAFPEQAPLEQIEPVGLRVLVRRDSHRSQSKAGVLLPDNVKIPVFTGRIVGISPMVEQDPDYANLKLYQQVLCIPGRQMPIDVEVRENQLVVIPVEDVAAIISPPPRTAKSLQGAPTL